MMKWGKIRNIFEFISSIPDESVETAVKLVRQTKIWFYIHYIYSHTTNLNER